MDDSLADDQPQPDLQTDVPHSARMWNYWLGGKDNYPVDRAAAEEIMQTYPQVVDVARASREFLGRAVRFLASVGIRQFLDIGTGLPTANNTHEVAQRIDPSCRVVYVDNDPLILTYARALLTSTPEGACDYIHADVRRPDRILDCASGTLDFKQPVALMLLGILGNVPDYDQAQSIVTSLLEAAAAGSFLVVNDGTDTNPARVEATDRHNEGGVAAYYNRSPEQIAGYFDGLELLEPGVVSTSRWRPELGNAGDISAEVDVTCGIGRKL